MNIMLGAISRHRREADAAGSEGASPGLAESYDGVMTAVPEPKGWGRGSVVMLTAGLSLTVLMGAGLVMWYTPQLTEGSAPILPPPVSSLDNPGFPVNAPGSSTAGTDARVDQAGRDRLAVSNELKGANPIVPSRAQAVEAAAVSVLPPATPAAPLPTHAGPKKAVLVAGKPPAEKPLAEKPPAQPPTQAVTRGGPESEPRSLAPKEASGPRLTKVTAQTAANVGAAWQAMSAGRFLEAEALYARVLNSSPDQVDALVGMASLLHRRGQREAALNTYRRALAQAPDNSVALTGTLALLSESDPATAESRLKDFIDARPQEDGAQVALGHLLGRQGRWSEAQAAFFTAYTLQPHSATHAYNLAVALDHLHQYGEALKYYRLAMDQATSGEIPLDSTAKRVAALVSAKGDMP